MMELGFNSALERLRKERSVLLAGAGGGFDIFCGLPLLFWLESHGIKVTLANLTFTDLDDVGEDWMLPCVKKIDQHSESENDYFPEKLLCQWFAQEDQARSIYCFSRTGVRPLRSAYEEICRQNDIGALVLVDGGTDSLLRGDEELLGTPHEDMLSLTAAFGLELDEKLLVAIGFGIDAYHGVCHAHVLETIAALIASGGYLGSFGLTQDMPEVRRYLEVLSFVKEAPLQRPSIVNSSIAASITGQFGHTDPTGRTNGASYWINPLMSQYWFFDADAVTRRSLYMERLEGTETFQEITRAILEYRVGTKERRPRRLIPH